MATRYFAFGCSYVDSRWGTLADLISANFDEYYNFGNAGGCNTLSCNRLIEADYLYNLNSETDYVTVGVTGIGRFSYVDKDENLWITPGDILHNMPEPNNLKTEKMKFLAHKFYSHNYAAYLSWVAIKTISTLLKAKNIKHKIYPSIDNLLYITDHNLPAHTLEKVKDILNMCDIKESVDEYLLTRYQGNRGVKYDDGCEDTHPSQKQYYEYLQAYFPEFDNEKTKNRLEYLEKIFDKSSMNSQTLHFMKFVKSTRSGRKGLWMPYYE